MKSIRLTEEQYAAHLARQREPALLKKPVEQALVQVKDALERLRGGFGVRLPFPPTVNHSTRPTASGGRFLTKEHRAFRAEVARIVAGRRVYGRLRVEIYLSAPTRRRYDIDNRAKAVLDALQRAGAIEDDWLVDELELRREPHGGNDCFVTIKTIAEVKA